MIHTNYFLLTLTSESVYDTSEIIGLFFTFLDYFFFSHAVPHLCTLIKIHCVCGFWARGPRGCSRNQSTKCYSYSKNTKETRLTLWVSDASCLRLFSQIALKIVSSLNLWEQLQSCTNEALKEQLVQTHRVHDTSQKPC